MRLALLHFQANSSSESVVDWVPTNLDVRVKFFIPAIPWALLPFVPKNHYNLFQAGDGGCGYISKESF